MGIILGGQVFCFDKKNEKNNGYVYIEKCNGKEFQKWTFEYYLDNVQMFMDNVKLGDIY